MALTAYSVALASNSGIELWLEASMPETAPAGPSERKGTVGRQAARPDTSIVLHRNLFGSEPAMAAQENDGDSGAHTAESLPDLRLRGTALAGTAQYAVFQDNSSKRQDVFSVGENVFGGPELLEVTHDTAVVLAAGRKYTIVLEDTRGPANLTGNTRSGGIRNTAPGRFLVDRREVDHSIENLGQVATELRAVPQVKNGQSLGFRIFNIRPGSVIDRMGLANGDIVQSVNGVTLDNPTKALAMLEDLRTADQLSVDFLRKNKPTTYTYDIR